MYAISSIPVLYFSFLSWVHIGDDFGSDCAPAKSLLMRTVWVKAESKDKQVVDHESRVQSLDDSEASSKIAMLGSMGQGSESVGSSEVFAPSNLVDGVYKVESMGSENYLAEMVIRDAVDQTVSTAVAATEVVLCWQQEARAHLK